MRCPAATVEVLIPDLGGDEAALRAVLAARPDVLGHNLETVPRLYAEVRPQAGYARSLELLRRAAVWARGETRAGGAAGRAGGPRRGRGPAGALWSRPASWWDWARRPPRWTTCFVDAAAAGVDLVTIGQYLQPRRECLPVARFVEPAEFAAWERRGAELGLAVTAAPFVRSSYRAGEALHGRPPAGPGCADPAGERP